MKFRSPFRKRIEAPPPATAMACPICGGIQQDAIDCRPIDFVTGKSRAHAETRNCRKFRCRSCEHLWTPWLTRDLQEVSEIYDGIYGEKANESTDVNFRCVYQLELITLALLATDQKEPCLDFGCGPNSSVTHILRKLGKPVHCCDISSQYAYDGEIFFRHAADPRWHNRFGGVVSIDVVEHLGDTVNSWMYFNRILKPNGVMYHIFPTSIHCDLGHHYVTNAFHPCIFSEKSLRILCEKTGFEFCGFVPSVIPATDPTLQNIFHFRKVRNV